MSYPPNRPRARARQPNDELHGIVGQLNRPQRMKHKNTDFKSAAGERHLQKAELLVLGSLGLKCLD